MKYDKTKMGGNYDRFEPTCWTEIFSLKKSQEYKKELILNELLKRYWRPVYSYLFRKGYGNDKSKDLTQGFFTEIVLGRDLFEKAAKEKGKFRTFLLTALEHFVADIHRYETAASRKPKEDMYHIDDIDITDPTSTSKASAQEMFDYAWLVDVLREAFEDVRKSCIQAGKETHWNVFEQRVYLPIMQDTPAPSIPDLCEQYGIKSTTVASNMIVTVKRRLVKVLDRKLNAGYGDEESLQYIKGILENI